MEMSNRRSSPGYYTVSGQAEKRRLIENVEIEYQNMECRVKFLLEVNNMTKWHLRPDKCYIHWGYIPSPPTFILPGEKESVFGHNREGHYSGVCATGATGVVSWKIGTTGKKLTIMYSLPYDFDDGKNKLAIAVVDENKKINAKFCRDMIVDKELATPHIFYDEIKPIEVKSDQFHIIGTMGNSHHSEIKIIFMPTKEQNCAPRFLCEFQYESNSVTETPVKEELVATSGTPGSSSGSSESITGTPVKEDDQENLEPTIGPSGSGTPTLTSGTPGSNSGLSESTTGTPVKEVDQENLEPTTGPSGSGTPGPNSGSTESTTGTPVKEDDQEDLEPATGSPGSGSGSPVKKDLESTTGTTSVFFPDPPTSPSGTPGLGSGTPEEEGLKPTA